MMKEWKKKAGACVVCMTMISSLVPVQSKMMTAIQAAETTNVIGGFENATADLRARLAGRYESGIFNAEGGVSEIVAYNAKTGWAYSVNGQTGKLAAISLNHIDQAEDFAKLEGVDIDVKALMETEAFVYGDMTSVAISGDGKTLAVAVQAEDYRDNGRVALFSCQRDGSLIFLEAVEAGVQPDMVTFTKDGTKVLTANEGEPRMGYEEGCTDPMGSVTVVTPAQDETASAQSVTVDFTAFDEAEKREGLVRAGVVLKKNTAPSVDLEPEYIAVSDTYAYISLQEANAIAVMDLASNEIVNIYPVGFEDYGKTKIDIDKKDEAYAPQTYDSLKGIRMPDGIAVYTVDGVDYLLAANEGDSREWGSYLNEDERNFGKGKTSPTGKITAENSGLAGKVVFFDTTDYDGLESDTDYLFGGRSFSLYQIGDNGMEEIYTSSSDFEEKTAQYLGEYFNCSNDDKSIDDRSGKKGPEPENVTVGEMDGKTYAFVGLERIGGIMIYDISNPMDVQYVNYINSRDFSDDINGDVSPEGLYFVSADESTDSNSYLLAACEVSGTVAIYQLSSKEMPQPTETPQPTEMPQPEVWGDVNGDGKTDLEDAQLVLRAALKIEHLDENQLKMADVDGNGTVELADAQLVLKKALKIL